VSDENLKLRTARTLKWNVIDRVSQQVLYAVTGIVLARELSQSDFGLVGAVLIFQAFASLLVDSGFSYALIQRKQPTRLDYSSVLWFNMAVATVIYVVLWFAAPLIAQWFENDARLIPLSRVMFLSFILNASAIVQTNRFVKQMNVRPVAMSNAIGLAAGAVVGIYMAVTGWGAWAIVWQTLVNAAVKSLILWVVSRWVPMLRISWASLRSFMSVGLGMMFTSFLNTLFLNIYSFFIGNRVGLAPLGYYTQSDKWSKMGISSLSQVITSTFLPVLSGVQDDSERFARMVRKMNRFTAYLLFPAMLGLTAIATPLFHVLFGVKWDPSILLFQLLLVRGIFTVLTGLYSNYLLALGRSKLIVWMEVLRDGTALAALAITFPYMSMTTANNPVYGVSILLWGQLVASVVAWIGTLVCTSRQTGVSVWGYIADCVPYTVLSLAMTAAVFAAQMFVANSWLLLIVSVVVGAAIYLGVNFALRSQIQADVIAYFRGKLK
jgi:O-antigen/teichoic acid export membrane protein